MSKIDPEAETRRIKRMMSQIGIGGEPNESYFGNVKSSEAARTGYIPASRNRGGGGK